MLQTTVVKRKVPDTLEDTSKDDTPPKPPLKRQNVIDWEAYVDSRLAPPEADQQSTRTPIPTTPIAPNQPTSTPSSVIAQDAFRSAQTGGVPEQDKTATVSSKYSLVAKKCKEYRDIFDEKEDTFTEFKNGAIDVVDFVGIFTKEKIDIQCPLFFSSLLRRFKLREMDEQAEKFVQYMARYFSILHNEACFKSAVGFLQNLLDSKKVNQFVEMLSYKNREGNTPLHISDNLLWSIPLLKRPELTKAHVSTILHGLKNIIGNSVVDVNAEFAQEFDELLKSKKD